MFTFLRRKSANRQVVSAFYHRIAAASLKPELFFGFSLPDTLETRFEILALHMAVVLRHMRRWPPPSADLARDLTDYYFEQLDDVLRELGISDNKVPKKMKEMAGIYLSRAASYDDALDKGDTEAMRLLLEEYLGAQVDAAGLAHYVFAADEQLRDSRLDVLLEKGIAFPVPVGSGGDV